MQKEELGRPADRHTEEGGRLAETAQYSSSRGAQQRRILTKIAKCDIIRCIGTIWLEVVRKGGMSMLRDIFNRAGLKRVDKDTRFPYEKVWDFAAKLIYIAIVAGICWFASAVLLFVFPAKWTFIVGLLSVIKFLGKWIFWITAIGALLCYIAGWIVPIFTRDQGDAYHELHDDNPHIKRRP